MDLNRKHKVPPPPFDHLLYLQFAFELVHDDGSVFCSHQVSLRGASSEEMSRDALLAKVSQARELRSYARRANTAAIFIQVLSFCFSLEYFECYLWFNGTKGINFTSLL